MAVAQIYGLKSGTAEDAEAAARDGGRPVARQGLGPQAQDFAAVAHLARAISGAGTACIRLSGVEGAGRVAFFPPLEGVTDLPAALVEGGAEGLAAGAPEGMRFWAGFALTGPAGAALGLLGVMDPAERVLPAPVVAQLQALADLLAGMVVAARADTVAQARRLLRLVDDVTELDDEAASPMLRGLLRCAAGIAPLATEALAMRIGGLAEARGNRLVLTEIAEGILSSQGLSAGLVEMPEAAGVAEVKAEPDDFSLMARLRIGEVHHDIARSERLDALGFRLSGTKGAWRLLRNGVEEGWPEIIAEILKATGDVLRDYVRMHMIHLRDAATPEGQYRYDLYGLGWTVRGTPAHAEVAPDGGAWRVFDASDVAWDNPRDLSALAGLAAYPDLAERIGADVHEWCKRIAAGCEVVPVFA